MDLICYSEGSNIFIWQSGYTNNCGVTIARRETYLRTFDQNAEKGQVILCCGKHIERYCPNAVDILPIPVFCKC